MINATLKRLEINVKNSNECFAVYDTASKAIGSLQSERLQILESCKTIQVEESDVKATLILLDTRLKV